MSRVREILVSQILVQASFSTLAHTNHQPQPSEQSWLSLESPGSGHMRS